MYPGTTNPYQPHFLNGWKEIANYLGKGVRTVQRYERTLALPVRRPSGRSGGSEPRILGPIPRNWAFFVAGEYSTALYTVVGNNTHFC